MLLFISLLFFFSIAYSLTCSQQTAIEKSFVDILESRAQNGDEVPGDTAADWLRLCFHDAVTWDPKSHTGGPHSCLWTDCDDQLCERHLDANAGLEPIMESLESSYVQWKKYLSRVDYWFLSCKVAIEWASRNEVYIPYSWGRTNCKVPKPYWPDRHPDPEDREKGIKDHFVTRLRFTAEESYALIGAHSIGRATRAHQGYDGRWVHAPENYFSNSFFQVLLSHDWDHAQMLPKEKGAEGEHQYITHDMQNSIMLFTDASMGWVMDDNDWGCNITRRGGGCKPRKELSLVKKFAGDNNYFLNTFATAWGKLERFGGDKLKQNPRTCDYVYKRGSSGNSGSGSDNHGSGSGDHSSASGDHSSGKSSSGKGNSGKGSSGKGSSGKGSSGKGGSGKGGSGKGDHGSGNGGSGHDSGSNCN